MADPQLPINDPAASKTFGDLDRAGLGKVLDTFKSFLSGTDPSVDKGVISTFTPQQSELFQALIGQFGIQSLRGGGGQGALEQLLSGGSSPEDQARLDEFFGRAIEDPARAGFQRTLTELDAKNASNLFSTDAARSKGIAASGLEQQLLGERARLNFQSREAGLNRQLGAGTALFQGTNQRQIANSQLLAQILGIPQTEAFAIANPGRAGAGAGIGQGLGAIAGGAAGLYFSGGNPYAGAAGATAGGAIGGSVLG